MGAAVYYCTMLKFQFGDRQHRPLLLLLCGVAFLFVGFGWLFSVEYIPQTNQEKLPVPHHTKAKHDKLTSGVIASMDSPVFAFSPGWSVTEQGADPHEPVDPWAEPSGVIEFEYSGSELAFELAVGAYWGYLFVTVDGEPANLLADISSNRTVQGQRAGYKTFLEPEKTKGGQPQPRWVRIHRTPESNGLHHVYVEIWRSWGQIPIRAVAVDALPEPIWAPWPSFLLLLAGGWLSATALTRWWSKYRLRFLNNNQKNESSGSRASIDKVRRQIGQIYCLFLPQSLHHISFVFAIASLLITVIGIWQQLWWLCLAALALLIYASLYRPVFWAASLLFALPFYFSIPLPILPGRSLGLIDIGILGGLFVLIFHQYPRTRHSALNPQHSTLINLVLGALIGWALVSALSADQIIIALREWRVVFLYAGLFVLILAYTIHTSFTPALDRWILVSAWLLGGTTVALIGLGQYIVGSNLITAEGVYRIRALYGSPNNLALYLERTVAVTLAFALFLPSTHWRWFWAVNAFIQVVALQYTFSKGAIMLGMSATFVVLALGGFLLLKRANRPLRPLWGLVIVGIVILIILAPSLTTERFQSLSDLSQGTGYLRIQIWRSSWQMALDHPLLGVGPDNFLYMFRSGYILPGAWQEPNLNHPHNVVLDLWTRLGIPGLVLGILFFLLGISRLIRNVWQGVLPVLSLGLLAAVIAALTHGLIDVSYALPDLMLIWVLMFWLVRNDASITHR